MLFTWPDPAAHRSLAYKIDGQITTDSKSKGAPTALGLQKDEFQEVMCQSEASSGDSATEKKYYVSSVLCRQQRVVIFTEDAMLATGTKVGY